MDALVVDAEAGTGASWLFRLGLRPAWTGGGWGDDLDWVGGRAGVADRLGLGVWVGIVGLVGAGLV